MAPSKHQIKQALARFIRGQRAQLGIPQRELAKRIGMSKPHISTLENGKAAIPAPAALERLAAALRVPYEVLLKIALTGEQPQILSEAKADRAELVETIDTAHTIVATLVRRYDEGTWVSEETHSKLRALEAWLGGRLDGE